MNYLPIDLLVLNLLLYPIHRHHFSCDLRDVFDMALLEIFCALLWHDLLDGFVFGVRYIFNLSEKAKVKH